MQTRTGNNPLFLAGATATGKSEVALLLAEKLGGEIISVDSMQVYRGLDIGTAKPGPAERARVPHHLIDVVEVTQSFDSAQFVRLAHIAVREIQARGRRPIFCGGTGLYFKVYLEGLGDAPSANPALRAELEATPLAVLLVELEKLDPITFAKIDRQNLRRVIRAVEVIRLTGRPFSQQRAKWVGSGPARGDVRPTADGPIIWGLRRNGEDLQVRINQRVDLMFQRGLVAEVENLLPLGLWQNKTALQAIGYRQVAEHLRGEPSLTETIELVKIRTRQFAKRQMTWFKRQTSVNWLECSPDEGPESVAARIIESIEKQKLCL